MVISLSQYVSLVTVFFLILTPVFSGQPSELLSQNQPAENTSSSQQNPSSIIQTSADITVYTNQKCSFCQKAKDLLKEKGVKFKEIEVNSTETLEQMKKVTGKGTVPQVLVNGKHIGSYSDLFFADMFGNLPKLLGADSSK